MPLDLSLRVRSFLGCRRADIPLTGIQLVGGRNGAGKSSLLDAAAIILMSTGKTGTARQMERKADGRRFLSRGAEAGSVSLLNGEAISRQLILPSCEVEQPGEPVAPYTRLASGLGSFLELSAEQRMAEITTRFDARPAFEDVFQFLKQHDGTKHLIDGVTKVDPDTGVKTTLLHETAAALLERTAASGWDAVHKACASDGTKMKGQWEAKTNRKWGSKIAREFLPALLTPGEEYSLAAHNRAVEHEKAKLEELIAAGGIAEAERRLLEAEAAKVEIHEQTITELNAVAAEIDGRMREVVKAIGAPDAPLDEKELVHCPKCGSYLHKALANTGAMGGVGQYAIWEAVELPGPEEREAQAAAAQALQDRLRDLRAELAGNSAQIGEVRVLLRQANDARRRAAEAAGKPVADQEAVAAQRERLARAEAMQAAVRQYEEARGIYAQWMAQEALIDATAPDGVRLAVLRRKIGALNAELKHVCEMAKFEPIECDPDLNVTYGGREGALISGGERWRTNFAFSCVFALREGVPCLLLDEFETVDADMRGPIIGTLKGLGLGAVIGMWAKDQSSGLPDLRKAELGQTWWMQAGELKALGT